MNRLELLVESLEYIERNLFEEFRTEDMAKELYCSKSALEKLFRGVNHMSVHEYVIRRRIVCAAKMIRQHPEMRILDIALMVGYSSDASFCRAFKKVWSCNPSEFTSTYRFSNLFPRYFVSTQKGDYKMDSKEVDISELYDLFQERKDCYFILGDIALLNEINKVSYSLGDAAILETMKRISEVGGKEDVIFRIGGDEFALLTNHKNQEDVEHMIDMIKKKNGEKIYSDDKEWKLFLHLSCLRLQSSTNRIQYDELFSKLHSTIKENKLG